MFWFPREKYPNSLIFSKIFTNSPKMSLLEQKYPNFCMWRIMVFETLGHDQDLLLPKHLVLVPMSSVWSVFVFPGPSVDTSPIFRQQEKWGDKRASDDNILFPNTPGRPLVALSSSKTVVPLAKTYQYKKTLKGRYCPTIANPTTYPEKALDIALFSLNQPEADSF